MSDWYNNVTATNYRMSVTTGSYALVGTFVGNMQPMSYRPRDGDLPYMSDDFESEVTDEIIAAPSVDVRKDDKIVVDGLEYRAHRIKRQRGGDLAHIVIPLSTYQP